MINIKKGNGLTLQQADKLFTPTASEAIKAGMVVSVVTATGAIVKTSNNYSSGYVVGFALNDQSDGDVIESGKVGVLLLDGSSVIETDQFLTTDTFTVGAPVYAKSSTTGAAGLLVSSTAASNDTLVGYYLGYRTLPIAESSVTTASQTWQDVAGTSQTTTDKKPGFQSTKFIEIKLAAAASLKA